MKNTNKGKKILIMKYFLNNLYRCIFIEFSVFQLYFGVLIYTNYLLDYIQGMILF